LSANSGYGAGTVAVDSATLPFASTIRTRTGSPGFPPHGGPIAAGSIGVQLVLLDALVELLVEDDRAIRRGEEVPWPRGRECSRGGRLRDRRRQWNHVDPTGRDLETSD
jgi:hypothetical protein